MMSSDSMRGVTMRRWILALAGFAALVAAAPADAAQTPRAGSVRARCTTCDPADSTLMSDRERKHFALSVRFDSLRTEFEQRRLSDGEREALEREMAITLRAMEELVATRAVAGRMSPSARARVEAVRVGQGSYALTVTESPRKGYLGVSFEGANSEYTRDNQHIIRFFQYPKIALVEPASPAERAGIRQGDTLMALNDVDVMGNEISLTRILVPERRLNVMVRRDGTAMILPVTVGRAPEYVVRRMEPAQATVVEGGSRRVSTIESLSRGQGGSVATSPRASVWVYTDGIGGARLQNIGAGLARALDVPGGVLVLSAPAGTPAHDEWGMREGDIIRRVAGKEVSNVREVFTVLDDKRGETVRVVIIRDRRTREISLYAW